MKTRTKYNKITALVAFVFAILAILVMPIKVFASNGVVGTDAANLVSLAKQLKTNDNLEKVDKLFQLVQRAEKESDYKLYSAAISAIFSSNQTSAQKLAKIKALAPGTNLQDLDENHYIDFVLTLPHSVEWVRIIAIIEETKGLVAESFTLNGLKSASIGQEAYIEELYAELIKEIEALNQKNAAGDLFDLVSRIYVWPSFATIRRDEAAVKAIDQVEYFNQSAKAVLSHARVPNRQKSLWAEVGDATHEEMPAYQAIRDILENSVWLADEESTLVQNALRSLLKQSDSAYQTMLDLVDWNSLGVINVTDLTREQAVEKAQTWNVYTEHATSSFMPDDMLCTPESDVEIETDDKEDNTNADDEDTGCCIKAWWMNESNGAQKVDQNPTFEGKPALQLTYTATFKDAENAKQELLNCTSDFCKVDEVCDKDGTCGTIDSLERIVLPIDSHIADGLAACDKEQSKDSNNDDTNREVLDAPNTGSLMLSATGELADLTMPTIIGTTSVTGIFGICVIVRLYTHKKF